MTRARWLVRLLIIVPATALCDDLTDTTEKSALPPSYKVLRFDESYLYLGDAGKRADLFDPIKYIPLRTGDPFWYLTIGGELRER